MPTENLPPLKFLPNPLRWIHWGIFVAMLVVGPQAWSAPQLVEFETAAKNGLQRAWFSQIRVDHSKNRVTNWTLDKDLLLALTSTGTVHAIKAESGRTQWVAQVGNPSYPSTGPAANADFVAVLSGSRLYMLDRVDGHLVWSRALGIVSETSPTLSETYAFVAEINGRVEGFPLDDPAASVWQNQSAGHLYHPPFVAGEFVAWASDRGHLYLGNAVRPRVLFRIETHDEIASTPVASGENLYATSLGGYLYCYAKSDGAELWRYSSGMPITQQPAVVDGRVYVASEDPALYAIDATSGRHQWTAEGVVQFVAQGADRVYGVDRFGTLLILDSKSGTLAGRIDTGTGISALANEQSDRIFLVSEAGLVQCLYEQGASEPTWYLKVVDEEEEPKKEARPAEEELEVPTTDAPKEQPAEDAEEEDNPFG